MTLTAENSQSAAELAPFTSLISDFYGYESLLADQEKQYIVKLRAFLEAEVRPILNDLWMKEEFFPRHIVDGLAELGLFGQSYPETQQFANSATFRGWVALELARVDASVATLVGMQNGLVMGSIAVAGSPEQRAEWLPRFASGELLGAFGLTEPLSGSDTAQGLQTVARREGDHWVINGTKRWIGNGSISDVTIIWARDADDNQVKGFIVPGATRQEPRQHHLFHRNRHPRLRHVRPGHAARRAFLPRQVVHDQPHARDRRLVPRTLRRQRHRDGLRGHEVLRGCRNHLLLRGHP
jgi:alkylation response protein AidB-like acyl-CoA dehydrogenase